MNRTVTGSTQSPGPGGGAGAAVPTSTAVLLAELNPNTDLPALVERVSLHGLPWIVVPAAALGAWEERDPVGWAKVSAWLAANDVVVLRA
jgi:hypothetical protein